MNAEKRIVNVSKADQNRVPSLTCVRLEKKKEHHRNIVSFIFTSHKKPKIGKNENKVTVWLQI